MPSDRCKYSDAQLVGGIVDGLVARLTGAKGGSVGIDGLILKMSVFSDARHDICPRSRARDRGAPRWRHEEWRGWNFPGGYAGRYFENSGFALIILITLMWR